MISKNYFENPTQVKFYDQFCKDYKFGIAYRDEIICGCCGGIFEIDEIIEECPKDIQPIITLKWIDITDSIEGE